MTTEENHASDIPETPRRPLPYWLRVVDDLIGDELGRAFAEDGTDPRDDASALRARIAGAVSAEDLDTTIASLEAIARSLGWDDAARPLRSGPRPRGFGARHGSGHRHGHHHGGGRGEHGDEGRHGGGRRRGRGAAPERKSTAPSSDTMGA